MAVLTEHVPVEQIREKAAAVDPAAAAAAAAAVLRVLLVVLAVPFLLIGWIARMAVRAVWTAGTWVFAAVQVGWELAGPRPDAEDGS
jgi:hypothetical protein